MILLGTRPPAPEDDCHDACDDEEDDDPLPLLIITRYWTKALPTSGAARTSPQHRSVLQQEA